MRFHILIKNASFSIFNRNEISQKYLNNEWKIEEDDENQVWVELSWMWRLILKF